MIRVSVLLSTRDRPAFLREALASLAAQTMPLEDFEVLVLDDGGAWVHGLTGALPQWTVHHLFQRGQSATLNSGIELSMGCYLTVAEDDDLVLPNKLAVLSAALDAAGPEVGAVYSLPQYTDADGKPLRGSPRLREYLLAHPVVTWDTVKSSGLFIHGTGTMYRREAMESVGGWDETLQTAEEYDLHLRLLHAGWSFQAVDAVTVTYRRHAGGKSQDRFRRRKLRQGVMERIYQRLAMTPKAVR